MRDADSSELTDYLTYHLPEALTFLEHLVEVNSFTSNGFGVSEVARRTAAQFNPLGFREELVPSHDPQHGPHLFLHRPGSGSKKILLVTHSDTVFPPEEEIANDFHWRPELEEGRIYGPGTIDIKGGTAMIWLVLKAFQEFEPARFEATTWIIAANASEEVVSVDFCERCVEQSGGQADVVLIFEGGNMAPDFSSFQIVTARKGKADVCISVSGRASHAGGAHARGRNAIVQLASVIQQAAALTDYEQNVTVNIGHVRGGTVVNRVPHFAEIELEMRAFEPSTLHRTLAALHALAEAEPAVPDTVTMVQTLGESPPWPESEGSLRILETFQRAAASLGVTVGSEQRSGLSDANYLHIIGPTVDGLGPDGDNDHCSERSEDGTKVPEYVRTPSFVPKSVLNVRFLSMFLED